MPDVSSSARWSVVGAALQGCLVVCLKMVKSSTAFVFEKVSALSSLCNVAHRSLQGFQYNARHFVAGN